MNQVVIYQNEDARTKFDVRLENQTVWLNQKQLTDLFSKAEATISEHIKHIFEDNQLEEDPVVRVCRKIAADRRQPRKHAECELGEFREIEDRMLETDLDRAIKQMPSPTRDKS
ncbi:MAG: hypothetical protein V4529_12070 [Gemmatimonadota bacterium]